MDVEPVCSIGTHTDTDRSDPEPAMRNPAKQSRNLGSKTAVAWVLASSALHPFPSIAIGAAQKASPPVVPSLPH